MNLTLIELDRPTGERLWFPFTYEEAGLGFTQSWWYGSPVYPDSTNTFFRALENNIEVARVHLDDEVEIDHYAGVPHLGRTALQIQFIEVRADHRLRGLGHDVIDLLQDRHPERRLVAYSEGADGFWSSLHWSQHLYADPEMASWYQSLFIQPEA